jgi:hypothetical protein
VCIEDTFRGAGREASLQASRKQRAFPTMQRMGGQGGCGDAGEVTYGSRGSKGLENAVRPAALGQPSMRGSSSARNPSMWSKDLVGTQREGISK